MTSYIGAFKPSDSRYAPDVHLYAAVECRIQYVCRQKRAFRMQMHAKCNFEFIYNMRVTVCRLKY